MPAQPTVIIIAGPTAVGKTGIAIKLAKELNTAIISADSRQCYHGMSIGTAQPSPAEQAAIRHYFVDAFEPEESLSAADFERLALQYLDDIFRQSDTAIVCGGTGLYIRALCEGLDEMPAVAPSVTDALQQQYESEGIDWLRSALRIADPVFYERGAMDNPARMLRALAFKRSTGKSITAFRSGLKKERAFRIIKAGLDLPRELLYQRINMRTDQMMREGLLEEAGLLFAKRNLKNLQTVGYTELFAYIEQQCTLDEAVAKIKQHSRNYAKRQLTWFKKDPDFQWFEASNPDLVSRIMTLL